MSEASTGTRRHGGFTLLGLILIAWLPFLALCTAIYRILT